MPGVGERQHSLLRRHSDQRLRANDAELVFQLLLREWRRFERVLHSAAAAVLDKRRMQEGGLHEQHGMFDQRSDAERSGDGSGSRTEEIFS